MPELHQSIPDGVLENSERPFMEQMREAMSQHDCDHEAPVHAMPRYKCHKEVWALKIADVETGADVNNRTGPDAERMDERAAILSFEDELYAPRYVDAAYVEKHKPEAGGYFVVYKDGYESFSPAKAFEDGYTRV